MEYDYEYFKNEFFRLTGINLHGYKEKQMKRRINTLMERRGIPDYREFIAVLERDPDTLASFVDYITINVTEFFRTPEHWQYFEQTVLPELIGRTDGDLKIWSTACATGEEPYSVVMSLSRYLPPDRIHVLATDIDQGVLDKAAKGIYTGTAAEQIPEDMMRLFFSPVSGGFEIAEDIRRCVTFRRLDLLEDDYPEKQDLIICRNVLIYFTEDAKKDIYRKFQQSLVPGGCLFTGNTEQIIQYKNIGFLREKPFIYRKEI